ncbi:MAG: alanine racemase [Ruminococcaceae bacterium]|nr:alanine racemase [Oscillospiraceae bacterium]
MSLGDIMDFLHRTWAEIDTKALIHNLNLFKAKLNGKKLMAVVKANAYGHNASDLCPILEQNGADWFAVSNINEAISLRECGIKKPILILGYTPVEMVRELEKYNISQCVYSSEYANKLSALAVFYGIKIKAHIKLDTGMSRLGFNCKSDDLPELSDALAAAKMPNIICEGVFTHFAVADRNKAQEDGFTQKQYELFVKACDSFKAEGFNETIYHCCNSAGALLDSDKHLDMARIGISLYGLSPSSSLELEDELIPVMTVKSLVSLVKEIKIGDTVSYGRTFKCDKPMKIATVTAGYADGYPRLLSNQGFVYINGHRADIVGRVCMDQFCVDVTDIADVKMGDEVLLFGKDLKVDLLADLCGTINYEITCGISPRVPRVILK